MRQASIPFVAYMVSEEGDRLERQYRDHLGDFKDWAQLVYARDWLLFQKNIGKRLSIDEVVLSQGELYKVITKNKTSYGLRASKTTLVLKVDVNFLRAIFCKFS